MSLPPVPCGRQPSSLEYFELINLADIKSDRCCFMSLPIQKNAKTQQRHLWPFVCGSVSDVELKNWVQTLPDVLLQVRALDAMCSPFLSKFPQTSFRISTFRMETHLDERPNDVTLMQFHELLSAEMETLLTSSEAEIVDKPSAKVLQPSGSISSPLKKAAAGDKACRFWGSDKGCKHGKECKFLHGQLEDQAKRCFYCSSPEHRKNECPHRDPSQSTSSKLIGGSGKSDGVAGGGGKSKGGW